MHRKRRSRAQIVCAAVAVCLLAGANPSVSAQSESPPVDSVLLDDGSTTAAFTADDLELIRETRVSERIVDLSFATPALATPTSVRVLLPNGYDAVDERYPVLYLLHGGAGQYTDWSDHAFDLTSGLPLITVMPDAGRSAWYTDWYNNGAGGQPMWETYHVDQLIPWIDTHFRTIADRSGRSIAGLSSGGFGTMSYTSRNPDLFVAAASFSGALDTNTPPVVAGKVIDALAAQDGGVPGSLFGLREVEEVRWRGSNPWDLAANLRDTSLVVRAGNGMAGGEFGGGGPTDPGGMFLEKATYDQSVSFHERLEDLGIEHVWDDYGPGTHNYAYWRDGLRKTLPVFMEVFSEGRPDPSPFSYRSISEDYDVYGWHVVLDRPVVEFSSLEHVTATGFTLTGSGSATVTTDSLYEPASPYVVGVDSATGHHEEVRVADAEGRLTLQVPLGTPNPIQQQFTPTHRSPATSVYTTAVTIETVLIEGRS